MKRWILILATIAVAPAQTTAVYLLNDGATITAHADLSALRTALTAAATAGDFCRLTAFRLDVSIAQGLPTSTAIALEISASGVDVSEPTAGMPADCGKACEEARAAFPDPPGVPVAMGHACDCFRLTIGPNDRYLKSSERPL